ncbi:hypothetical protein L6164_023721 [Bauhinia variegata]|uniref:Uncharacterized protein n=1 Tax=Bauhinia variegata TaxID=167791 RepID=A0ACB9MKJ1_BAUVA|nr:hypothetical protein L6164_023721 [Bauhinia variegata]
MEEGKRTKNPSRVVVHRFSFPFAPRDGQVEEPHSAQPVLQGSQEWHQETKEAPPHFHQRDGSQVSEEPEVFLASRLNVPGAWQMPQTVHPSFGERYFSRATKGG